MTSRVPPSSSPAPPASRARARFRLTPARLAGPLLIGLLAHCGGSEEASPGSSGTVPEPSKSASRAQKSGSGTSGTLPELQATPWWPADAAAQLPAWAPGMAGLPDRAAAAGLDYVNRSGEASKPTILDAGGAGVAALDLGGDGDSDLVFGQGLARLADVVAGPGADLEVFENTTAAQDGPDSPAEGPLFRRVAGPGLDGWWTGLATGDVDGDGDADLVAGGYGGLELCLQSPEGRLERAPEAGLFGPGTPAGARIVPGAERSVGEIPWWVTSVALFDADRDGDLDLYVGQYLELDPLAPQIGSLGEGALALPCNWKGRDVYCGPRGLVAQPDRLLRGGGDGTFVDVTETWLPRETSAPGYTLAVGTFDADADGDTDLYVASDSAPNRLWINGIAPDGTGTFLDAAGAAGVAYSSDGEPEAGMGFAAGDVNRDGLPDFAITNFSDEPNQLFFGAAQGFESMTSRLGLLRESRFLLSWSTHLIDTDGDGWLELFSANGHVYPQADDAPSGTRYRQPDALWRIDLGASDPRSRAVRIAPRVKESVLLRELGTRGSAVADFDGNGTPDLALAHIDAPAGLGLNYAPEGGQRLWLHLEGPEQPSEEPPRTPRDAKGTRVVAVVPAAGGAPEYAFLGEVQTSVGYQSASTPWVHIGLGAATEVSSITVIWPSGARETLPGVKANQRVWIREGAGVWKKEAL